MIKSFLYGILILIAGQLACFLALMGEAFVATLILFMQVAPILASIVVAWTAPRKKPLSGTLIIVPAAVLYSTSNLLLPRLGFTGDFPGVRGALQYGYLFLVIYLIPCMLGSFAGYFISTRFCRSSGQTKND